jgi:hypothetical protein
VWFAGVHCNVGGGYPKQGMSLVTLDWMVQKASQRNLRILAEDRKHYWDHGTVDDKLYDSRAGLGVFYRWKPRNMLKLSKDQKAGSRPRVHLSVFERIAHGTDGYAPGTLAPDVQVVYTASGNTDQDETAAARADAVSDALTNAFKHRGADLNNKVRGTLILGRFAYYIYVASCVYALAYFSIVVASDVPESIVTRRMAPLFASAKWVLAHSAVLWILFSGFITSGAIAYYVGRTRSLAFSRFWHSSRHELRRALKEARERRRTGQSKNERERVNIANCE